MATSPRQMNGEGDFLRKARPTAIGPVDAIRRIFEGSSPEYWQVLWDYTNHLVTHPGIAKRETAAIQERLVLEQQKARSQDPVILLGSRFMHLANTKFSNVSTTAELADAGLRSLDTYVERRIAASGGGITSEPPQEEVIASIEIDGQRAVDQAVDLLYGVKMSHRRSRDRPAETMSKLEMLRRLGGRNLETPAGLDYDEEVIRRTRFNILGAETALRALVTRTTQMSDSAFNNHPVSRDSIGIAFIIPGKSRQEDAPEIRYLDPPIN